MGRYGVNFQNHCHGPQDRHPPLPHSPLLPPPPKKKKKENLENIQMCIYLIFKKP